MRLSMLALPKKIINAAVELVYPRSCCVCGGGVKSSKNASLCETCFKEIKYNRPVFPASAEERRGRYFDRAHSVCVYEGITRECVHKFKYDGALSLETLFTELMANYAERYMDKNAFDLIVPVPLHRTKLRERSFNQAAILASFLSRKLKIPCVDNNLIRVKAGRPQIDLPKKERLKDIKGAFKTRRPILLNGSSVLLVDDVLTTGATVNECSKVLKLAGVRYVEVLTLA